MPTPFTAARAAAAPRSVSLRDLALQATPRACAESILWLAGLPAGTTPERAWLLCSDAGWLLWFAATVGVTRRLLVEAACDLIHASAVAQETPWEEQSAGELAEEKAAVETGLAVARAWAAGETDALPLYSERPCAPFAHAAGELRDALIHLDRGSPYMASCALADVDAFVADGARLNSAAAYLVRAALPWRAVAAAMGGGL